MIFLDLKEVKYLKIISFIYIKVIKIRMILFSIRLIIIK